MKKQPRYFIREYADDYFFHGGIGIIDAERVLEQQGYEPIKLPYHYDYSFWAKFSRFWFCWKLLSRIEQNAVVVFIYPLHARLNNWLANRLRKKNIKVVCMIGDINGLKDGDPELLKREIRLLSCFDHFIVHNQGMMNWLNKEIPGRTATMIEFFDFLTPAVKKQNHHSLRIAFAGNLDKSKFLADLDKIPLQFDLYGPGVSAKMMDQQNVYYHGVFDPYELPAKLEGSYGLVWDGESIYGMKGSLGNYMQYISHHKLSLYILAGLPIITSFSAGAATLVKKYKIGFCVNGLPEINSKLDNISASKYEEMSNNMLPLADRIAKGNCLATALKNLLDQSTSS